MKNVGFTNEQTVCTCCGAHYVDNITKETLSWGRGLQFSFNPPVDPTPESTSMAHKCVQIQVGETTLYVMETRRK